MSERDAKPVDTELAWATTDELFAELRKRTDAYVFCMVHKTGTFQVTYGGSLMANLGMVETARTCIRRDALKSYPKQ